MTKIPEDIVEWARLLLPDGDHVLHHERPWGSVFRISSDAGIFWLKLNHLPTNEAALMGVLGKRASGAIPEVVGVHARSGAFVMKDAGRPSDWQDSHRAVARIMHRYADIQLRTKELESTMREIGTFCLDASSTLEVLNHELSPYWVGLSVPPSVAYDQIVGWSQELELYGIPHTIQHDDLHPGNVVQSAEDDYVFLDWSDASFAHPFGSLLYPLDLSSKGIPSFHDESDRERRYVLDAYLDQFTTYGNRADLYHAVSLATRLACVGRALVWHRARPAISASVATARSEYYLAGPSRWLRAMLLGGPGTPAI